MKDFKVTFTLSAESAGEAEWLVRRMAAIASESVSPTFDNFNVSLTDENGLFMVGEGRMSANRGTRPNTTDDDV